MKTKPTIKERLTEHLNGDGCPNDSTTDELYREAHHIPQDAETDYELEAVEKWAFDLVNRKDK